MYKHSLYWIHSHCRCLPFHCLEKRKYRMLARISSLQQVLRQHIKEHRIQVTTTTNTTVFNKQNIQFSNIITIGYISQSYLQWKWLPISSFQLKLFFMQSKIKYLSGTTKGSGCLSFSTANWLAIYPQAYHFLQKIDWPFIHKHLKYKDLNALF